MKVRKCDGEPPVCPHFLTFSLSHFPARLHRRRTLQKTLAGAHNALSPVSLFLISHLRFNVPSLAFLFRSTQICVRPRPPLADSNFLPAASFRHQSFHPSITSLHRDFVIPMLNLVASIVQWFGKTISQVRKSNFPNQPRPTAKSAPTGKIVKYSK